MLFESTLLKTAQHISTTKCFLTNVSNVQMLEVSSYKPGYSSINLEYLPSQIREREGTPDISQSVNSSYPSCFQFSLTAREKILDRKGETKNCSLSRQSLINQTKLTSRLHSHCGHLDIEHMLPIKKTSLGHVPVLWINLGQLQSNIIN